MEEKRLLMIVNPCAGMRRGIRALPKLHRIFETAGYHVSDYITTCRGDGERLAAEIYDIDLLVCVGGDGTLNELISGAMKSSHRIPIGYIPAGSTNDFARSLGIPHSFWQAARNIAAGKTAPLDIGEFGDRHFSYIASFGAFSKTSYSVPQRMKNLFGHAAYILRGIADVTDIRPLKIRIETGDRVIEDTFIFGAVSNATSFGGLLQLDRSTVDFCDGKFEVMLIRQPKTPHQLSRCLSALATKKYYENEQIIFFHTDALTVHADPSMAWTLDGEYAAGSETVTIRNLHGAIDFVGWPADKPDKAEVCAAL